MNRTAKPLTGTDSQPGPTLGWDRWDPELNNLEFARITGHHYEPDAGLTLWLDNDDTITSDTIGPAAAASLQQALISRGIPAPTEAVSHSTM